MAGSLKYTAVAPPCFFAHITPSSISALLSPHFPIVRVLEAIVVRQLLVRVFDILLIAWGAMGLLRLQYEEVNMEGEAFPFLFGGRLVGFCKELLADKRAGMTN